MSSNYYYIVEGEHIYVTGAESWLEAKISALVTYCRDLLGVKKIEVTDGNAVLGDGRYISITPISTVPDTTMSIIGILSGTVYLMATVTESIQIGSHENLISAEILEIEVNKRLEEGHYATD